MSGSATLYSRKQLERLSVMKIKMKIVTLGGIIFLSACGGSSDSIPSAGMNQPPPGADGNDALYVKIIRENVRSVDKYSDTVIINMAKLNCKRLRADWTPRTVTMLMNNVLGSGGDAIVGTGSAAYCPEISMKG